MSPPLRLKAIDAGDLAVLSACLQDALVLIGDMAYLPEERRFVLAANRFVWEQPAQGGEESYARTGAGLTIDAVSAVRRRNLDPRQADRILSLLAIRPVEGGIRLTFSGEAEIELSTSEILVHLQDLGEPWPTAWRPRHGET